LKQLLLILFFCLHFFSLPAALIILDPGHGGKDEGARIENVFEKKLTLRTAYLVKQELEALGHRVVLTRARDLYISLASRTEIASRRGGDLFVSLHYNSSKSPSAHGLEIYYYAKGEKTRMQHSRQLASSVLKTIAKATSCHTRGVKNGNFHVIRETTMPAILIEGGFLTNHNERSLFTTPEYLETFAKAVAEGIDAFALTQL
jgi:N-acetylmuramoyl-L-alanine amidase